LFSTLIQLFIDASKTITIGQMMPGNEKIVATVG